MTTEILERKFALSDAGAGAIEGIASPVGGSPDRVRDIVAPGAFARSLDQHKARGTLPAMLVSHNPAATCGAWEDMSETPKGLKVRGRITLGTAIGDETYRLVKSRAITFLSIGYRTIRSTPLPGGFRRLDEVDLVEVSLVSVPAAPGAVITSVKSCLPSAKGNSTMAETATPAGDDNADLTTRVGALETGVLDLNTRLKAVEDNGAKAVKSLDRIETAMKRPGAVRTDEPADGLEKKAWQNFLRHGREALPADEIKSLRISNDVAGGVLAAEQFEKEVLKEAALYSPVRQLATIRTTGAASVTLPRRTGTGNAHWVSETEERKDVEVTFGQLNLPVREIACFVDISNRLLEDSGGDAEREVIDALAEEYGRLEADGFVTGTGANGEPNGIMADAGILTVNTGDAAKVTADSLITLYHQLPSQYRGNGSWAMNSNSLASLRKLKDGNGNYLLLQAGIAGAVNTTLLGRPVCEFPEMDEISGGACPVLFGDFKAGFRIYDRLNMSLLRDPFTQQTKGLVRFHSRRRVGAGVVKPAAFRKLCVAV